jgi:hypothetical protein
MKKKLTTFTDIKEKKVLLKKYNLLLLKITIKMKIKKFTNSNSSRTVKPLFKFIKKKKTPKKKEKTKSLSFFKKNK